MNSLFQGFLIGFTIASIIGPISILCVKQTLNYGFKAGYVSTLGATTIEGFYGSVAAFGISQISNFLIENQFILKVIGGSFLLYIGLKSAVLRLSIESKIDLKKQKLWKKYLTIVSLTLPNPMTIMSFLAVFTSINFVNDTFNPYFTVIGLVFGSTMAYLLLISVVTVLKKKSGENFLKIVNEISSIIIILFAAFTLYSALKI